MMCAVSLPVTLSLYRSLPPLSIIHVYYSCRISRQADNGLVLGTTRSEVTRLWFITCGGTSWGGGPSPSGRGRRDSAG